MWFVVQLRLHRLQLSGLFSFSLSLFCKEEDVLASAMEEGSASELTRCKDACNGENMRSQPDQHSVYESGSPSVGHKEKDDEQQQLPGGWTVLFVDDDLMLHKLFSCAIKTVSDTHMTLPTIYSL